MLRIKRLLIARMPVLMDVSNHDSDGFTFDVVVGEEGGNKEVGVDSFSAVGCFGSLAGDKTTILFIAMGSKGSLHSQAIYCTVPNLVMQYHGKRLWHSTS
jgi:hypothetical protein